MTLEEAKARLRKEAEGMIRLKLHPELLLESDWNDFNSAVDLVIFHTAQECLKGVENAIKRHRGES